MKKYFKYALWTAAGLFVLAFGVVAYLVVAFDPNDYKPQIIQAVKDKQQRTLKLDGDIKLRFFPSLGVSLGPVSLSEFQSEREFASVTSASVALKLWPLLSRRIVVDAVAVSGLKAQLIKYRNGKTNIDDLLGAPSTPAPQAAEQEAAAMPLQFDIAAVELDHVAFGYRDEASGAQYSVQEMSLKTGRIASGQPITLELALHAVANQPRLDIAAQLKTVLTFDLDRKAYQLQGLSLQASGAVLDITGLSLKAAGDASALPAAAEFSLKRFTLAASGAKGADRFAVSLNVPALNYSKDKFVGDSIALNAKLNGMLGEIEAALSLPALEGNARAFKVSMLGLDVDVKQPEQTFKLKLVSPLTGSVEAQQVNLSDLRLAVNASGEQLPGKRIDSELKGSIQADLKRQSIQGNLAGGLLQSQIKAKAAVNNFTAPVIRYDLEIDQFDADPFMPKKAAEAKSAGKKTEPEQPFDLSALKTLNLEGSLRIGSLKAANIRAAQVRVDAKARDGIVNIAPLAAKMYEGGIDGKLTVNAHASGFAVNAKLTGIDIAPLLKDALDLELAEGRGNIALDLTARGNTVGALKKTLNGNAGVNLGDGAIKGVNLPKLVQGVQSLGKDTTTQTLGVDKNEKTSFSEFKASFRVKNGVAHNDDLAVKSTVLRITGGGDIDIGHGSLNYNAKAIFAKTEQGRTATLPVTAYGAFDDLKFKVDYAALLADLARQKLDEKKEALKSRAQDELRSKAQEELKRGLKNLFK